MQAEVVPSTRVTTSNATFSLLNQTDGLYHYPCLFVPTSLTIMRVPPNSVFITTLRNTTQLSLPSDCSTFDFDCSQEQGTVLRAVQYAGFSAFQTFSVYHSIHSIDDEIDQNETSMASVGTVDWAKARGAFEKNGEVVDETFGNATEGDAAALFEMGFTLGDLLYLAGQPGLFKDPVSNHYMPSLLHRNTGGVLQVNIKYQNSKPWLPFRSKQDVFWQMSVTELVMGYEIGKEPHRVEEMTTGTTFISEYLVDNDVGWLIICTQEFDIRQFDIAVTILNLSAALTLMAACTVVIDQLAMRVMPMSDDYRSLMVVKSADMSQVRDIRDGRCVEDDGKTRDGALIIQPASVCTQEIDVGELRYEIEHLRGQLASLDPPAKEVTQVAPSSVPTEPSPKSGAESSS